MLKRCFALLTLLILSNPAFGLFVDGKGHYSLRGETRTNPDYTSDRGYHQGIRQSFRLNLELRGNDRTSFFVETRLWEDQRLAFLGDTPEPERCSDASTGENLSCSKRLQDTTKPWYKPIKPRFTEAYAQYAMDTCLLKAGRKGRNWGMGALLSTDYQPFSYSSSVYDGISCDINIQKAQTLGFSVGYDKLSETGSALVPNIEESRQYGSTKPSDDIDQFFFTIEIDDRKANEGTSFARHVGIYFSNALSGGDTKTDLKLADLYTGFYLTNWTLRNELMFRLGKTADPNVTRFGGLGPYVDTQSNTAEATRNNLDAIGLAGSIEYLVDKSGSYTGPEEFKEGTLTTHSAFFEYAYAPGDKDGYYELAPDADELNAGAKSRESEGDNKATGFALHRNYKPALILFNGLAQSGDFRVDGIYDPEAVMNTTLFALGYRYKSLENGNFELKLITAKLNETMPAAVKAYVGANKDRGMVGYGGSSLGYELDLKYSKFLSRTFEWGVESGVGLPGPAFKRYSGDKAETTLLLQAFSSFFF
ncbi:MAG: hypothetical protein AB7T49_01900 [Oligoflexales bacterium]